MRSHVFPKDRTYALGVFAFGKALLFDQGVPIFALRAKIGTQIDQSTLLPQAETKRSRLLSSAYHWLVLLVAALTLAACGASGYSQTVQTASYNVQLSLDGTNFDTHTATIEVRDKSSQPVNDAQVLTAPVMQSMGMAAPEQTAQPLGSGKYQVKGEFFSMIGEWEFDVRVTAGGRAEEIARFKVPVQQ